MTRKAQQVYALGRDVFAKVRWLHRKAFFGSFIEQLRVDQMDLAEIGLGWIGSYACTVLHPFTQMSVTSNAQTCDDLDLRNNLLREIVSLIPGYCDDRP